MIKLVEIFFTYGFHFISRIIVLKKDMSKKGLKLRVKIEN